MPNTETQTDHTQAVDNVLWKVPHRWNERIEIRLSAVEHKVVFTSGFAAAAGALIGSERSRVLLTGVGRRAVIGWRFLGAFRHFETTSFLPFSIQQTPVFIGSNEYQHAYHCVFALFPLPLSLPLFSENPCFYSLRRNSARRVPPDFTSFHPRNDPRDCNPSRTNPHDRCLARGPRFRYLVISRLLLTGPHRSD